MPYGVEATCRFHGRWNCRRRIPIRPWCPAGGWVWKDDDHTVHTGKTMPSATACAPTPHWSDDDIFERARVKCSPDSKDLHGRMDARYYQPSHLAGCASQLVGHRNGAPPTTIRCLSASEEISGIPGSQVDHFGVLLDRRVQHRLSYAPTYSRALRSADDGRSLLDRTFRENHAVPYLRRSCSKSR